MPVAKERFEFVCVDTKATTALHDVSLFNESIDNGCRNWEKLLGGNIDGRDTRFSTCVGDYNRSDRQGRLVLVAAQVASARIGIHWLFADLSVVYAHLIARNEK